MTKKELKLGDEGSAILIIQSTQSDPQKALSELIENSIDAKAKIIKIIRHRKKGEVEIIVKDDGEGVNPGTNNNSDMDRVATGICDSCKKKLSEQLRENIQGEFAIGLLGFAAISENLEMISRTAISQKTAFLNLKSGSLEYESGFLRKNLENSGTEVRLYPVRKNISNRLTAEKLKKYLGEELRERIKKAKVKILIKDNIGRKRELEVKPLNYVGYKIQNISKVKTQDGNIIFKLFIGQQGEEGKVSVYRRGTKVIDDVSEIPELKHEPWNNPMLKGMIDSRFINVPPGTRKGIVPDIKLQYLINAAELIENIVINEIKKAEELKEKALSRDVLKTLRDAFSEVIQELPEDYSWFDTESGEGVPTKRYPKTQPGKPKMVRIAARPLDRVTVTPKVSQMLINERKIFVAKAWTPNDELIPINVKYRWEMDTISLGRLEKNNNECVFVAGSEEGDVEITVQATLEGKHAQSSVEVIILKVGKKTAESKFPTPIAIYGPTEFWRSRWNKSVNTLEYNSGHNDYLEAKGRSKKTYLRYLGFLFSKHLVLHNFRNIGEDSILERMIEVVTRLENRL
jgi:hypothetical protein